MSGPIEVDLSAARQHIEALTGSADARVTFQTYDDKKLDRGDLARKHHGTIGELAKRLTEKNLRGAGIFVMVNAGDFKGRRAANVVAPRALFIDCDDGRPRDLMLPPSFTVHTARGAHHYWKLKPGELLDRFTATQEQLAKYYDSDPKVKDVCRVMRLAGFLHMKGEPFPVAFKAGSGKEYTIQEILEAHPLSVKEPEATPGKGVEKLGRPPSQVERILSDGIAQARKPHSRNEAALWTACQLRDERVPLADALALCPRFVEAVPQGDAVFTVEECQRAFRSAYSRPPREPRGDEAEDSTPSPPLEINFYSLADLWRTEVPPTEGFLARELFCRESVNLLAGRRGAGKTYFVLKLIQCIATGEPFGPMSTRKGRVLFLSQEMSLGQIVRRVRKLLDEPQAQEFGRDVVAACKLPIRVDSDAGADHLRRIIEVAGTPDVVIIDALRDVKGAAAEDSNDEMGRLFGRLRDLVAVPLKICVIIIHHKGKPSDNGGDRGARGASAMEDVSADVLYLDQRKGGARVGSWAKSRDDEAEPFTFTLKDDQWPDKRHRVIVEVEAGEPEEAEEARKVADFVGDRGSATGKDVEMHFGWKRFRAGQRLEQAEDKGWIAKGGKGGANGLATLWVPAYSPAEEASA